MQDLQVSSRWAHSAIKCTLDSQINSLRITCSKLLIFISNSTRKVIYSKIVSTQKPALIRWNWPKKLIFMIEKWKWESKITTELTIRPCLSTQDPRATSTIKSLLLVVTKTNKPLKLRSVELERLFVHKEASDLTIKERAATQWARRIQARVKYSRLALDHRREISFISRLREVSIRQRTWIGAPSREPMVRGSVWPVWKPIPTSHTAEMWVPSRYSKS